MQLLTSSLCVLALVYGGGGVTKSPSIAEFWTDDYKVFEQIYGRTSDRDLYGTQLPISYPHPGRQRSQASEKKVRIIENDAVSNLDSYAFGDRYAKLFGKQVLDEEITTKPPKTLNFISYNDFKPISQQSDPETYNYLKNLEQYSLEQKIQLPQGIGGFKPFLNFVNKNPEEEQAYKSIQDILEAHDANKGAKSVDDEDDQANYLNYGPGKSQNKPNPRKKQGVFTKPRCLSGRCRKRTSNVRVRTRPYLRKVVQNRWINGY